MERTTEVTFSRAELFNILSDNLAACGCNDENLKPDGTVGPNMREGFWDFLTNTDEKDNNNLMIRLLKAGGYNDALEADGAQGDELTRAINLLLQENGQKPFSDEDLNNDEYATPDGE